MPGPERLFYPPGMIEDSDIQDTAAAALEKLDLKEDEYKGKSESSREVAETGDPAQRLKTLKGMLDAGLITEADYNSKKAEVLASI
jgi:hypothetical protein